jgi:queuine/archaeosine tRNA-ribosyltransferase
MMAEMRQAIENRTFQGWQAQFARDRATKSVQ